MLIKKLTILSFFVVITVSVAIVGYHRIEASSGSPVIIVDSMSKTVVTPGEDISFSGSVNSPDGQISSLKYEINGVPSTSTDISLSNVTSAGLIDSSFNSGDGGGLSASGNVAVIDANAQNIMIAGSLSRYNGIRSNYIARLNLDGTKDNSFDSTVGANGQIYSMARLEDGKVIIGGSFTSYGGVSINRIAIVNSDGSLDTSFNPGAGPAGTVNSVSAQDDGKFIIGGSFTTVDGVTRNRVARLNSDGSLDTSFDPGVGPAATVNTVIGLDSGEVLIGGTFTTVSGTNRGRIARLNVDGTLDTTFATGAGANNTVKMLSLLPDGTVYLIGSFTTYDGVSRGYIARLNLDGTLDTSFDGSNGANNRIEGISQLGDGRVFIGGIFTTAKGVARNRVAIMNSDGSLDTSFDPGVGPDNTVNSVGSTIDGNLLIGGLFINFSGASASRFAGLNSNGTLDSTFNPNIALNGGVNVITTQPDGKILVGGSFSEYAQVKRMKIVRLNPDGTIDLSFDSSIGANSTILDIEVLSDGDILIVGQFTTYNGTTLNRITKLNSDGSLDSSFNAGTGANGLINSIVVTNDGKIIITGGFTTFNGISKQRIVGLNADGSLDTSYDIGTGFSNVPEDIILQADGKALIVGNLGTYKGSAVQKMIRLNPDGSLDTSFSIGTGILPSYSVINTVGIDSNGKPVIGGDFVSVDGIDRNRIARLNTDGSVDLTFDSSVGSDNEIEDIYIEPNNRIIAVGSFTQYDGINVGSVARINTDGSIDDEFITGLGFNLPALTVSADSLGRYLIGGDFTSYDVDSVNFLTRVNNENSADFTFSIDTTGFAPGVYSIVVTATDSLGNTNSTDVINGSDIEFEVLGVTTLAESGTSIYLLPMAFITLLVGAVVVGGYKAPKQND